jgi:hypothetical protein
MKFTSKVIKEFLFGTNKLLGGIYISSTHPETKQAVSCMMALCLFISGLNKITRDDKKKFVQHGFGNLNAKRGKKIKMQPRLEERSDVGQMRKIRCGGVI